MRRARLARCEVRKLHSFLRGRPGGRAHRLDRVLTGCKVLHTLAISRFSGKGTSVKEQTTISADSAIAPTLLTPALVEKMLASREAVQVMKFRTTCTDCLPNY